MNRVVKTTIASALVLSMALGGTTAAMAAAPAEEENCISAASIANLAENTRIKLFNKSVYAKYNPGVTVEKDENSPTGYTVTFIYKEQKSSTTIVKEQKIYPNDPCPCGSGKKYKKCCGRNK